MPAPGDVQIGWKRNWRTQIDLSRGAGKLRSARESFVDGRYTVEIVPTKMPKHCHQIALLVFALIPGRLALDNGLGRNGPAMGWSSCESNSLI